VKTKRRTKKSRTKSRRAVFHGFHKLTRSDVKWLKRDSKKVLETAKKLISQKAAPPARPNVTRWRKRNYQQIRARQFGYKFGLATAIRLAVQAAIGRDQSWGVFFGEMIPFLARKMPELTANQHFARRISEMSSAQKARKKGRTLRAVIEEIIREARSRRHFNVIMNGDRFLPRARRDIKDLERRAKLLKKEGFGVSSKWLDDLRERLTRLETAAKAESLHKLPEFSLSSADQWFEQVVWPELQVKQPELRDNPLIGDLKKANKSGKFQLSDLKMQALQTVRRLAALPQPYYFG
jgi:hypothetical protein